jgi:hypothetical protein
LSPRLADKLPETGEPAPLAGRGRRDDREEVSSGPRLRELHEQLHRLSDDG